MAEITPLKAVRTGGVVTALAEMQPGDTIPESMLPAMDYEAPGAAAAAVSAHEAADDPHPQYARESALGTAAALDVASSGDAAADEVVTGSDTRLTDARPASDVSAWAKGAAKPSYTAEEVGAAEAAHSHAIGEVTGLQAALDAADGVGGAAAPTDASYSYANGRITGVTETVNGAERSTVIGYNPDGTVASVATTYAGVTRTETYQYSAGIITGMTATES